jgi:hypothetical protein
MLHYHLQKNISIGKNIVRFVYNPLMYRGQEHPKHHVTFPALAPVLEYCL